MPLYKIELSRTLGIVSAKSLADARKEAYDDHGKRHVVAVTRATEKDISWFKSLGGYIREV